MQPYASLDKDGNLHTAMAKSSIASSVMRWSALAHFVEMTYNDYEAWQRQRARDAGVDREMARWRGERGAVRRRVHRGQPYMLDYTRSAGSPRSTSPSI